MTSVSLASSAEPASRAAKPDAPDQVRFDVMSIYYDAQEQAEMELYRDAFDWR